MTAIYRKTFWLESLWVSLSYLTTNRVTTSSLRNRFWQGCLTQRVTLPPSILHSLAWRMMNSTHTRASVMLEWKSRQIRPGFRSSVSFVHLSPPCGCNVISHTVSLKPSTYISPVGMKPGRWAGFSGSLILNFSLNFYCQKKKDNSCFYPFSGSCPKTMSRTRKMLWIPIFIDLAHILSLKFDKTQTLSLKFVWCVNA